MAVCPTCGHKNPETNKFCGECATPLGAPARSLPDERKVATILFCDLVSFTARSESLDRLRGTQTRDCPPGAVSPGV